MLIKSDFLKYGFNQVRTTLQGNKIYSNNRSKPKYKLQVETIRKGIQKVDLSIDDQYLTTELMWSPEQLRLFLLSHKVIDHSKK